MSGEQLQALWIAAGGDPNVAQIMAAIALTESGGSPTAVCYDYTLPNGKVTCSPSDRPDSFQVDVGLWQVANVNLGASKAQAVSILTNPTANAQAAIAVLRSQGLGAWSSYGSALYRANLALVQAGRGGSSSGSGGSSAGSTIAGTSIFTSVVESSSNPFVLLQNWIAAPSVNVIYKAFAFVFVLLVLGSIPQTSRFSLWAALCVLVVLLIQPNKSLSAPSPLAANVAGGASAPLG